nr:hypothetical protein [Tanacetum cinerariifolium]
MVMMLMAAAEVDMANRDGCRGGDGGVGCGDDAGWTEPLYGDGEMVGDGGGWQRWLLWMAAVAMVEESGDAWRRWVVDLVDRGGKSIFGVHGKNSSKKGFRRGGGDGRRRLPEIMERERGLDLCVYNFV